MALSFSTERVDENGRELLSYGTADFPIAFFDDDLNKVKVPWHWHDEFEIALNLKGRMRVYIGGEEFSLLAGEGYFANSGILHSAVLCSKEGRQHAMVFGGGVISSKEDIYWKKYVSPVLSHENLPFVKLTPSKEWQAEALNLAGEAWLAGAYEREDYALTVRGNLSRIFSLIIRNADTDAIERQYTSKRQRDELRVKKALAYIEAHYTEELTIEDIAGSADISVSTCLRVFHDVMHTTPVKHLIRYRLMRIAEELRLGSGRLISEAAFSNGFSDISYFNRCFRREYGATPTEYKKAPAGPRG